MYTSAQADPFHFLDQMTKARFDVVQHFVKSLKAVVLAIVVEHKAADQIADRFNQVGVMFAQARKWARRIGEIKA